MRKNCFYLVAVFINCMHMVLADFFKSAKKKLFAYPFDCEFQAT